MVHLAREPTELVDGPHEELGLRAVLRELPLQQRVEDELLGFPLAAARLAEAAGFESEGSTSRAAAAAARSPAAEGSEACWGVCDERCWSKSWRSDATAASALAVVGAALSSSSSLTSTAPTPAATAAAARDRENIALGQQGQQKKKQM